MTKDEKRVKERLPSLRLEIELLRKDFEQREEYEMCAELTKVLQGISDFLLGYTTFYDLYEVLDHFQMLNEWITEQELKKIIGK